MNAKSIKLAKVPLSIQKVIPKSEFAGLNSTRLVTHCNTITGDLILKLDTYIWGLEKERIDVSEHWPQDWWQAFKERWFPQWCLNRFPVKYKTIEIHTQIFEKVCPHLNVISHDHEIHMRWFVGMEAD